MLGRKKKNIDEEGKLNNPYQHLQKWLIVCVFVVFLLIFACRVVSFVT